jgi:isopenicillin N synthase-like dioxygenase
LEEQLASKDFEAVCLEYFETLKSLTFKVFNLIGISLLSDEERQPALKALASGQVKLPSSMQELAYSDDWPIICLRLLRYPSATKTGDSADKPQYGASAHADFSAITLLLQDENPGLEVIDTSPEALASGKTIWRPIDPNPDAYVVNIGDIVKKITGGLYKSSVHRVVCKRPENERYSVVYFFDGCVNARLDPLQDSFANGRVKGLTREIETVESHMYERLGMSYGDGKKDERRDGETVFS